MVPSGTTFDWSSGTFLATVAELESGSDAIEARLAPLGIAAAGAPSGGGSIIPWPAHITEHVRLTKDMDEDDAQRLIEQAYSDTFTFTGAITSGFSQTGSAAVQTVEGTIADVKGAGADLISSLPSPKGLAYGGMATVIAVSVAVAAVAVAYLVFSAKRGI